MAAISASQVDRVNLVMCISNFPHFREAQDSNLKVGKLIWVAGHSGPETAEDSRTHFGIFAPGVTQLLPDGHVINLHPWEHNEVAPALGAALATDVAVVALLLTRPPVDIPDRKGKESLFGLFHTQEFQEKLQRWVTPQIADEEHEYSQVKVF